MKFPKFESVVTVLTFLVVIGSMFMPVAVISLLA
jgi:hypothetical protein